MSLKNFNPTSPETTAMDRYGDVPVDLSNGLVNISVPIFNIKSRSLSLPISLSYHASGIKVQDVSTPVGLGWVLNAGGSVSRNVVGKADEKSLIGGSHYFRDRSTIDTAVYNLNDNTKFSYLSNLANGNWDSQSDNYHFNIPGVSGKFVYDTNFTIQYQPVDKQLKILRTSGNMFNITDDAGIYYEFTETEKTTGYISTDTTTWHLTKMISADKTDTITFEYTSGANYVDFENSDNFYINVPKSPGDVALCELQSPQYDVSSSSINYTYYRKLLTRINFANGFVKFDYINDRQDPSPERLAKIEICRKDSSVVKQIKFGQSYFVSQDKPNTSDSIYFKRLRLDSVSFQTPDSVTGYKYSFDYNSISSMPGYRTSSTTKPLSIDFWGYYNGSAPAGNVETLLPSEFSGEIGTFLLGAYGSTAYNTTVTNWYHNVEISRSPSTSNMQVCMLNTIHYPTGGTSTFEYETHKIANTGTSADYVGGLRIKKVTNYDSVGKISTVKSYQYSLGLPSARLLPYNFFYTKATHTYRTASIAPYFAWCESVNFYITGNPFNGLNYSNGSAAIYDTVTEISGTNSSNIGKTVNIFDVESDSLYSAPYVRKYTFFSTDKEWARGGLLSKKIYKNNGNSYTLIKEIKNQYSSLGRKDVKIGELCELMDCSSTSELENYLVYLKTHSFAATLIDHFDYEDVTLQFGVKKLIKTEEIDYLNDTITKKKVYVYGSSDYLYPTKTYDFGSVNGDTLITVMKYPQDRATLSGLGSPASDALDSMVAHNIKDQVIQTEHFRNSTLLTRDRTDFINYSSSGRYYAQYENRQLKNNGMEQRIEYKTYDSRGNVLTLGKINDQNISYIWDYDSTLVIAQAQNASSSAISYTSFETNCKGGWTYTGAANSTYMVTGDKSYLLSNGDITKTGLSSGVYIVSYWGRSGSATVNSSGPTSTGKTIGNWTYYEHVVTGTSITISGSVYVDEVRLYPKGAFMSTFTYKPLIGMTSKNDPTGKITFYEYDSMNRLKTIKDEDGNILKRIDYKFLANYQD